MPQTPSASHDGTVRGGLWAGLPITSNPWSGDDPVIVAAIRERVEPQPAPPDGPPMSARERARYRMSLADDVELAYAAVYVDALARVLVVYAVRHADAPKPVIAVQGDQDSDCSRAVRAHLDTVLLR